MKSTQKRANEILGYRGTDTTFYLQKSSFAGRHKPCCLYAVYVNKLNYNNKLCHDDCSKWKGNEIYKLNTQLCILTQLIQSFYCFSFILYIVHNCFPTVCPKLHKLLFLAWVHKLHVFSFIVNIFNSFTQSW